MNSIPTLAVWLQALLVLAAGAAVLIALATMFTWKVRSGVRRRTVWQAATVGLAMLFLGELGGFSDSLRTWFRRPPSPSSAEVLRPEITAESLVALSDGPADLPTLPQSEEDGDQPLPETPPLAAAGPEGVWWPGAVWLLGAAAVATRACLARLLLVLFRQRHGPTPDAELQERVKTLAARLGVRRRVLVLEANGLRGPAAFGIVWPTIAVPARFTEHFTSAQQEAMLAHELGHLALGDPAWHQFADLITAVWWWHPLAWWARHRLRAASELAADEASVVVADGPGVLAGCLVELGGRLAGVREGAWARMAGSGFRSSLGQRVERLMRLDGQAWRPAGRLRRSVFLILASAALLAAALLPTAWARSQAFPEGDIAMQTMKPSWQRSLAAMALVAALGPTSDAVRGDPPPGQTPPGGAPGGGAGLSGQPGFPGLGGGGPAGKDDKDKKATNQQTLEKQLADLDVELATLQAKVASLQELRGKLREVEAQPGKQTEKVETQLKTLQEKAAELGASKAAVEGQIAALQEKRAEATAPRIKVFRLQHRDPEEVRDVLAKLLPRSEGMAGGDSGAGMMSGFGNPMGGGPRGRGGMMQGGGPGGGGRQGGMGSGMGPPGGVGQPGMMGPGGFGGGPGGGGMMGMAGFEAGHGWRLAVDGRTNCLIVRGSEQDLQMASDLVAMLDLPEGKAMPRLKNIRAFKLKFADPAQVAMMLQALEINATIAPAPKATLLVVSGPEAALKEVAEVIEAVDVEGKPATGIPGGKGGGPNGGSNSPN